MSKRQKFSHAVLVFVAVSIGVMNIIDGEPFVVIAWPFITALWIFNCWMLCLAISYRDEIIKLLKETK